MIVKTDFLNKLKDFGLNTYEAKIWCALLSKGVSTAGELSDIAAVPRSRSYDVLDSLERKGFIITKLGKPFKYLAVSPNEVIERVKKNIKENAKKKIESLNNAKETELLKELSLLHSQGIETVNSTELTGYIKSRSLIYNQLTNMINNAQSSVIITCSNNELIEKYKIISDALEQAKKRNINIKILVSNIINKNNLKEIKQYAAIKQSSTKNRFAVVDNKQILLMLEDENKIHSAYDAGVWLNSKFFVNSLMKMFDSTWKKAKPL